MNPFIGTSTLEKKLMRRILLLLPAFGCFGVGYVVATLWPVTDIVLGTVDGDVERAELAVTAVGAVATLLAVVVALFQVELRSLWDNAQLAFEDCRWVEEEIGADSGATGGNSPIIASGYTTRVRVKNTGSQAAKSCEIILEELHNWSETINGFQPIDVNSAALPWTNAIEPRALIPSSRHMNVELISLRKSSGGKGAGTGSILQLGNHEVRTAGRWRARFTVYGENARTTSLWVEVRWNGVWHDRLAEMRHAYTVCAVDSLTAKV